VLPTFPPRSTVLLADTACPCQKGQKDSWAHRLGVLSAAVGAITREAIGDTPRPAAATAAATPPSTPSTARLPVVEDDGKGAGVVGGDGARRGRRRRRVYHLSARPKNKAKEAAVRGRSHCCESMLVGLSGEVTRQLEVVAAGERRMNNLTGQNYGGGGGNGNGISASLREEALSLRAEESALLEELALRQAKVDILAEELRGTECAVEEVGVSLGYDKICRFGKAKKDKVLGGSFLLLVGVR